MKLYEASTMIIIIVCSAAMIGVMSAKYFGNDNLIEEVAEEVIESQSGLTIDLTPGTPEHSFE